MPTNLQAKLLKVLESGEVYPLGDTRPKPVDVRIVSATNTDLESRIKEGRFREDLYWRLDVIEIKVPPLRERMEDIEMLSKHFIEKYADEHKKEIRGVDGNALAAFMEYSWPGNVRELRNVIERSVVLTEGPLITVADLPEKFRKGDYEKEASSLKAYLSNYERHLILATYKAHNKNKEETAKALGIDLATLYRKFKKYEIEHE